MRYGSLFTGIGGFDLGLDRAGMECAWQVEIDDYATKVLEKHWPEVKRYRDIRTIDWSQVERPDLVCGGFPCQPVSLAGKGLAQQDERWLWPEFARCIGDLRPRFVLVENVPGLLGQGMGDVLGDLATLGYDAEWESIPAASVGARHLRLRVFVVASSSVLANVEGKSARYLEGHPPAVKRWFRLGKPASGDGWLWPDESGVGRRVYGVPRGVDRLRCLGNAVVPQVAEWIGRRIVEVAS